MGKDADKDSSSEDEIEERGQWDNPAEFILSCLGYAVGLGNVWRFPYLCYDNGGGAFLIPYFIMLTFVGIPVFMIELAVGQYSASGPATVWEAAPLFRGVGFGMLIISFISSIYYNLVIAWSLYYFVATFSAVLPWQGCDHDYNSAFCYSLQEAQPCNDINGTWFNQTCFNETYIESFNVVRACTVNETDPTCYDNTMTDYLNEVTSMRVSPSEEYFQFGMLDLSSNIGETGTMSWKLVLALIVAWVMCFLCILKGVKSSGKVVYFTATFPYLLLVILLVRAVLLPGAKTGILFYLTPKWEILATPKVWADAAGQIFFSLSAGTGGLMTFASYNKFNNNIYRDTLIVAIGNCLTSFFAGFAIFSIIGYISEVLGRDINSATASGSGLAFIAYPEVCTLLPLPQLWAAMFFFMLVTLGLDSQFASLENIQTALTDTWPALRKYKWATAGVLCTSMFVLGLTQCTQAGWYWTDLMSYYSSGWSLILMGMIEGMIFPWLYGANRLIDDIESMTGVRLWKHWWVVWVIISPLLLIVVLIVNFIDFTPLEVNNVVLPNWSQTLGWLMAMSTIVSIPFFAAYEIWKSYKNPQLDDLHFGKRLWSLCQPSDKWMSQPEKEDKARMVKSGAAKPMDYQNPAFQGSQDFISERI